MIFFKKTAPLKNPCSWCTVNKNVPEFAKPLDDGLNMTVFRYQLNSLENDFSPFSDAFNAFCQEQNIETDKIFDLAVSLEELIVNSFTHGSKNEAVTIEATVLNAEIKIRVEDQAPPFNLLREAPPPPTGEIEERKIGGLGIHLVKSLNDRVEYAGSPNGNVVTLLKKLK